LDYSNLFYKKPVRLCDVCGEEAEAEFVDNGFGPYSVQAGPYNCFRCGWVETGCPAEKCIKERCFSWDVCQGKSIIEEE